MHVMRTFFVAVGPGRVIVFLQILRLASGKVKYSFGLRENYQDAITIYPIYNLIQRH